MAFLLDFIARSAQLECYCVLLFEKWSERNSPRSEKHLSQDKSRSGILMLDRES